MFSCQSVQFKFFFTIGYLANSHSSLRELALEHYDKGMSFSSIAIW